MEEREIQREMDRTAYGAEKGMTVISLSGQIVGPR